MGVLWVHYVCCFFMMMCVLCVKNSHLNPLYPDAPVLRSLVQIGLE